MKYKAPTLDGDIVFSLLSSEEADSLYQSLKLSDNPYLEEYIFNKITEKKYETENLLAGVIILIIYLCFKKSGVFKDQKDIPEKIIKAREEIGQNFYMEIYKFICRTQPMYTLSQLREMSLNQILELYIFAEKINGAPFLNTDEMMKEIKERESSKKVSVKVHDISHEEIDLVKHLLKAEELRKEIF